MSNKRDDLTSDEWNDEELNLSDDAFEPTLQHGPTVGLAPVVGKIEPVLQKYTHCEVCGGRLHFVYVSDFSRNTTHEKSSCPECSLQARQVLHRLQ